MQHQVDTGWEEQDGVDIKGVRFAGGQSAVTKGIWMWMYPYKINGVSVQSLDSRFR